MSFEGQKEKPRKVGKDQILTCHCFGMGFGLNANCSCKPWEGFRMRKVVCWILFSDFILGLEGREEAATLVRRQLQSPSKRPWRLS
jgi:hypothetical protein